MHWLLLGGWEGRRGGRVRLKSWVWWFGINYAACFDVIIPNWGRDWRRLRSETWMCNVITFYLGWSCVSVLGDVGYLYETHPSAASKMYKKASVHDHTWFVWKSVTNTREYQSSIHQARHSNISPTCVSLSWSQRFSSSHSRSQIHWTTSWKRERRRRLKSNREDLVMKRLRLRKYPCLYFSYRLCGFFVRYRRSKRLTLVDELVLQVMHSQHKRP